MVAIRKALRDELGRPALTAGLAVLGPGESVAELVARADHALYARRIRRRFVPEPLDEAGEA
jgi:hypothetical protein